MISHEEDTCPKLTDEQLEANRRHRGELTLGTNRVPPTYPPNAKRSHYEDKHEDRFFKESHGRSLVPSRERRNYSPPRSSHDHYQSWNNNSVAPRRDLRHDLKDKRETRGKEVWNRIEKTTDRRNSKAGARYHPYHRTHVATNMENDMRQNSHHVWRP